MVSFYGLRLILTKHFILLCLIYQLLKDVNPSPFVITLNISRLCEKDYLKVTHTCTNAFKLNQDCDTRMHFLVESYKRLNKIKFIQK